MPSHILIPTDGTELSEKAAAYGVEMAKTLGARVTAVTVTAPGETLLMSEGAALQNRIAYEERAATHAARTLSIVETLAAEHGVACETVHARVEQPWRGILDTASEKGCDLIVIASHGRRGLSALMIGSETQKVLSHSTIPVLVYRAP